MVFLPSENVCVPLLSKVASELHRSNGEESGKTYGGGVEET